MSGKIRDGVKEINKICKLILKLQTSDFEDVEKVIKEQEEYNHPLKMDTTGRINDLAEYNKKIINYFKELKKVIEKGKDFF